ncbi:outer membrane beta-barrel protein [Marinobacter zhejiangensis]|uniref:Outer membrane protein beta-barrel domain-containing protein n=1 Tax=Marinobacter zhejiangensis TaxID=488535 RepID=A0A1I4LKL8_9GAMM|nr:outer membrane beta-barrel protein [Marinobacter zhejiangensis]SFL91522.1 Outer membrane protein beta-barrel domain-containing protein [Marinobacter zhejiangensis]
MIRSICSMTAFTFLLMSGAVFAGSDSGLYVGASVGSSQLDYSDNDPDLGEVDFDDDDAGYKIFAGYNLGFVPLVDVAVEGAYVDFGEFGGKINNVGGNDLEVTGWTLAGLAGVNLGPVGLFAKVGAIDWDGDIDGSVGSGSDDGTDPLYGIGAKFQLMSFQVRAEYELFDLDEVDIDYFSVGAAFTF